MINLDFSLVVTILYIVILYLALNALLFKPIAHVLHQRRELVQGREEGARKRIAQVDAKATEYENALKAARAEAYKAQERLRDEALAEKSKLVATAKSDAQRAIQDARGRLATEAESARVKLEGEVHTLARELTSSLLRDNS